MKKAKLIKKVARKEVVIPANKVERDKSKYTRKIKHKGAENGK